MPSITKRVIEYTPICSSNAIELNKDRERRLWLTMSQSGHTAQICPTTDVLNNLCICPRWP